MLRIWLATSQIFDGLYGQDPYAYYDYGAQVLHLIRAGQPLGVLYYPLGYPILNSLSFLVTGIQPLGPQAISLICGALATVFTGLLTMEVGRALGWSALWSALAGIGAWAVLTVCPQLLQSSIVIMSDAPALMWTALSGWALLVYGRTQRPLWIGIAAFALAFAAMTRWQYALLGVPWAVYVLLVWRFRPRWRHVALAVGVALLTLLPQIVYTVGQPKAITENQITWNIGHIFARDFVTGDGITHYQDTMAAYYLLPFTSRYYTALLFLPLMVMGLFAILRSSKTSVLILGWALIQFGFLIGIPVQNFRYPLAFYVPLAVLAGLGVVWLAQLVGQLPIPRGVRLAGCAVIVALFTAGLVSSLSDAQGLITGFVANKNRDLATVRWVEEQIPDVGATVYGLDLTLAMQHYSSLKPVQIYYETAESIAARLAADRPAYALFNVSDTETRWQGKAPWIVYHWLLDNPGLESVGTDGAYTLFRVR